MCYTLEEVILMIKGVVFDLDHTLFDRYATFEECAPLWYERFKKNMELIGMILPHS